jgi:hypothetical protein
MKKIPPEISARFDDILKLRNVPHVSRPEYWKWLRYFLDFHNKYPLQRERSAQVRLFSEKLRSKGQVEMQVEQAAAAISLFFASQKRQVNSSLTRAVTVPPPVVRGVPEKPLEHDPVQPAAVKNAGMVCEPPEPPTADGLSERRKGRYDDWRCLRKSGYPAWDSIIALLADEINTRHYSRKTLQHYANWSRKFQSYLSHKDPSDVRAAVLMCRTGRSTPPPSSRGRAGKWNGQAEYCR